MTYDAYVICFFDEKTVLIRPYDACFVLKTCCIQGKTKSYTVKQQIYRMQLSGTTDDKAHKLTSFEVINLSIEDT